LSAAGAQNAAPKPSLGGAIAPIAPPVDPPLIAASRT